MVDVFVSRPNALAEEFVRGFEGFKGLLEDQGFNLRTVGASDYPVDAPLDAVIRMLEECKGAVILGYPQIFVTAGFVKEEEVGGELLLPTEWNHIEAALAYAKGIPLLVIHHPGINRGIFDRGAISSFIYEEDLSRPEWPLSPRIRGAIRSWKDFISSVSVRSTRLDSESSASAPTAISYSSEQLESLKMVSEIEDCTADDLASQLDIGEQKAQFFIDEWIGTDAVHGAYTYGGSDTTYYLTPSGRKILNDAGLLD